MNLKQIVPFTTGFIIGSIFFSVIVSAWSAPTLAPPNGNASAPVNLGPTAQVKNGSLGVNALAVFGNAVISGNSSSLTVPYISLPSSWGSSDSLGINANQVFEATNGFSLYLNYSNKGGDVIVGGQSGFSNSLQIPNGRLYANGEVQSALTGTANVRMIGGSYGAMFRNDGSNTYFLLTASGDQYGSWNALRPLYINDVTGQVNIGTGLTFPDGTTQTTAGSKGKLVTQTVSNNGCISSGSTISVNCPSGWIVIGCPPPSYYSSPTSCSLINSGSWSCVSVLAVCVQIQ